MLGSIIKFFLENKLVTLIVTGLLIGWGLITAPFDWNVPGLPRSPVAVDAIPDLGENQQIVFTKWPGRSPQDVEDQVTYPLSASLTGIPGVSTVRTSSMFGLSYVYLIFDESAEFYASRSRILEKLNALPAGTLPDGVTPMLGPDATALGQVFWYTLEGRDPEGNATGGWDPHELRSIQDYNVRYALSSVKGVSEVASVGGFVKEYQVDVDPTAMKAYGISLMEVMDAVRKSNLDVGARTLEMNRAEYVVRGLGYLKSKADLEASVIKVKEGVPIRISDVARVAFGPAPRRGALDKAGAEAVGGVVVARFGSNPLAVIQSVKEKIAQISGGLPRKTLDDGTVSQLSIVPFYDRTELIHETLGTLEEALSLEILVTLIVIILMVLNLRASLLISSMLPIAVLMCFIAMRHLGVDANIVALSGIAIAIGTIVDMGIVLSENMLRKLGESDGSESSLTIIFEATREVAGAVVTAVATTVVSFLPVFTMEMAEGKLFRPLAFTKTFALLASVFIAIVILPALAHSLFSLKIKWKGIKTALNAIAVGLALILMFVLPGYALLLLIVALVGLTGLAKDRLPEKWHDGLDIAQGIAIGLVVAGLLAAVWMPLGPQKGEFLNFLFVALLIGLIVGAFHLIIRFYTPVLRWCLNHKIAFLTLPLLVLLFGLLSWKGFESTFGFLGDGFHQSGTGKKLAAWFPGTKKEFMPPLDEGAFLYMPTSMPHSGMEENAELLHMMDMAVNAIPEVETVVGKLGRVESALDPAPISMFENVILYKDEYKRDENGHLMRFEVDEMGEYARDETGELIQDPNGRYFRQWRDHIQKPADIWKEIDRIRIPGLTPAPPLQPIETRLLMLQTGIRTKIGIRMFGTNLDTLQAFGFQLEKLMKTVKGMKAEDVVADRPVGKPYLEIDIDRQAISRYGLKISDVQSVIEGAIGGMAETQAVEGRDRYPVRVRYAREYRNDPAQLSRVLVPTPTGQQIPLGDLTELRYSQGPQAIKGENMFLISYVLMNNDEDHTALEAVENAKIVLDSALASGTLKIPQGVSYEFTGEYENQLRAESRLRLVIPLSLILIFFILYLQFRSTAVTLMIFSAIVVAFSGGFILIGLYGQEWFLNFGLFGVNLRDLFNMETVKVSTAVWVGFIALFGIATDDGVVMATYLEQSFRRRTPESRKEIRAAVVAAGQRRIRPCLMTTATTLLALLPILTSTGRGSDIMIPMAIPAFGGMAVELITLFIIPVLYSAWKERRVKSHV